ncbi:GSCOCG00003066001-RA-CDS [Cotesia congregata]|nr:GSCOCG00003066001-RA-CDS [Cotesia congregata]
MYDVKKKIKYENNLSNDHKKRILDISTLESLKICATSSEDFTIKIWSEQNILLRIIEVNLIAKRLTFSSLRGDIIFSVAKHLYILPHENYLPREYKEQIEIKNISEQEKEEDLVAKDEDEYLDYEEDEIKSRVLHPVSSVPLCSLALSSEVPRLDALVQEQKRMHLRLRERDIKAIELGIAELSEKRKKMKKKKAVMNYEDWEKYVDGLAKEIEMQKRLEDKFDEQKREILDKSQDCKLEISEWLSKMIPNSLVRESKKEEDIPEALIEKKIYKYEYPENLDENSDKDLISLPLLEDLNE